MICAGSRVALTVLEYALSVEGAAAVPPKHNVDNVLTHSDTAEGGGVVGVGEQRRLALESVAVSVRVGWLVASG
jgi:hypothetical protein